MSAASASSVASSDNAKISSTSSGRSNGLDSVYATIVWQITEGSPCARACSSAVVAISCAASYSPQNAVARASDDWTKIRMSSGSLWALASRNNRDRFETEDSRAPTRLFVGDGGARELDPVVAVLVTPAASRERHERGPVERGHDERSPLLHQQLVLQLGARVGPPVGDLQREREVVGGDFERELARSRFGRLARTRGHAEDAPANRLARSGVRGRGDARPGRRRSSVRSPLRSMRAGGRRRDAESSPSSASRTRA